MYLMDYDMSDRLSVAEVIEKANRWYRKGNCFQASMLGANETFTPSEIASFNEHLAVVLPLMFTGAETRHHQLSISGDLVRLTLANWSSPRKFVNEQGETIFFSKVTSFKPHETDDEICISVRIVDAKYLKVSTNNEPVYIPYFVGICGYQDHFVKKTEFDKENPSWRELYAVASSLELTESDAAEYIFSKPRHRSDISLDSIEFS